MITYNTKSVREGLVVFYDAGNKKSYPGTGTTFFDLSGNAKNGTFHGGITYNTLNGGKLTFDGNSYIDFGVGSGTYPIPRMSTEFVFRCTGTTPTTGVTPHLCGLTFGYDIGIYDTQINASVDNGTAVTTGIIYGLSGMRSGGWNHLIVTDDGATRKMYLNGVLRSTTAAVWVGQTRWPTNTMSIGMSNNNTDLHFTGDISIFKLYSRDISDSEVATNFNAIRGRYGL